MATELLSSLELHDVVIDCSIVQITQNLQVLLYRELAFAEIVHLHLPRHRNISPKKLMIQRQTQLRTDVEFVLIFKVYLVLFSRETLLGVLTWESICLILLTCNIRYDFLTSNERCQVHGLG